jgi:hypothetical protein
VHYCHNCHVFGPLAGAYCQWCLSFYYANGRMPRHGDAMPDTLTRLYDELDRMIAS